jgi:molybdate transport system substrate-binding protein
MSRKALLTLVMLALMTSTVSAADRMLTVFAAASLTDVLQQVGDAYTTETGRPVRFSFASSSALARQIESGAPADVFMSADLEWMDYLQTRKLLMAETRINIATNELVLVAPVKSTTRLRIAPGFSLAKALGKSGRLATGDPESVPVGKYAKAALTQLGVWESVKDRLVPADNVRTALNFVALGEAPLGIVYATDAKGESKVRVVDVFPASSHVPILYPVAATISAGTNAGDFLRFLRSSKARALFQKAGFGHP